MTLVELLVVLLALGVIAGMSAFAGSRGPVRQRIPDRRLDSARSAALMSGRPTGADRTSGGPVLFLPDGRAVGNDVDPLTGRVADAR